MNTGQKIKTLREAMNMTQTDLANKTKSSKQTIYKYENSIITNIPSDKIELIAKALETTPAYLMGWEENSEKHNLINEKENIIEKDLIKKFRQLDSFGKRAVENTINTELKRVKAQNNKDYLMPIAAHEGPHMTEEGKKHDLEILKECYEKYCKNDNDK